MFRLASPAIFVQISASLDICIAFLANISTIVVFIGIQKVAPRIEWLLVVRLLAEQ